MRYAVHRVPCIHGLWLPLPLAQAEPLTIVFLSMTGSKPYSLGLRMALSEPERSMTSAAVSAGPGAAISVAI